MMMTMMKMPYPPAPPPHLSIYLSVYLPCPKGPPRGGQPVKVGRLDGTYFLSLAYVSLLVVPGELSSVWESIGQDRAYQV